MTLTEIPLWLAYRMKVFQLIFPWLVLIEDLLCDLSSSYVCLYNLHLNHGSDFVKKLLPN